MSCFFPKGDDFFVEDVNIRNIEKNISTPFYCYSKSSIVSSYKNFYDAFGGQNFRICYAVKANSNINVIKIFADLGSGADVVSMGEIWRCIKSGIDPKNIVFAGVGKSAEEIKFALENGVEEFSVESEGEMFLLNEVASKVGKNAKLSIRVNPDVDAKTHRHVSTGRKDNKFGIDINRAIDLYQKAKNLSSLDIFGISVHIGSQILSVEPFRVAFLKTRDLYFKLLKRGFNIRSLDFGGGVGISYSEEAPLLFRDYAQMIKEVTEGCDVKITLAPGRAMVGNSGIMVAKIIYVKNTDNKSFVVVDSGMNDLMRPGLYDSYHRILQVERKEGVGKKFDVVGPICESTDVFARGRHLIDPRPGDLLIFDSCGAYGSTMSNEYNSRPLIPEILVEKDKFSIIRRRPSYEEMVRLEI